MDDRPVLRRIVLALCCVCVLSLVPARAQDDDESDLRRVQRDQNRVALRLQSLQEKMERLAGRYDAEGRTRNAELLRDALEKFGAEGLLEKSREIEQGLESERLSTLEQQDDLVGKLESIYAILRDRRDEDDLREKRDMLSQALGELGNLASDERSLLARTRAATDAPKQLVDEAQAAAQDLQDELSAASQATGQLDRAQQAMGESAVADELARRQRNLSRAPDATSDAQDRLRLGVEEFARLLEQPLGDVGSAEHVAAAEAERARAREAVARAAEAMQEASDALRTLEGGEARDAQSGDTQSGDAQSGDAQSGDAQSGEAKSGEAKSGEAKSGEAKSGEAKSGEAKSGEAKSGEAKSGEAKSGEAKSGEAKSGEAKSGEAKSGEAKSGEAKSGEAKSGEAKSGEAKSGDAKSGDAKSGDAQSGERQADGAAESGEPSEQDPQAGEQAARERMDEAAGELEAARDALQESERMLNVARNRSRASATSASSEAEQQAQKVEELAERLETLEPEAGPELLDRTRELLAELAAARKSLESGDLSRAQENQQAAQTSLNDMLRQLEQRGAEASATPAEELSPEARQELVDEQARIQKQLRDLMDRLEELPDQDFQQSGERAQSAMDQAGQNLQQRRDKEAATREEEAAEQLDETIKKLQGEKDRYEQLRQEDVLFQLGEELTALVEKQTSVADETVDLDGQHGEDDRLPRSARRALARLSGEQRDLSDKALSMADTLDKDGAVAFVFALRQTADDMGAAADRLADEQTGVFVQSMQESALQRLADLQAVLEAELQRRRDQTEQPQEGEQPQDQPQGEPPLVPPVAELLLLQRMELQALARLDRFAELNPEVMDGGELGPMERDLLERWAMEHARTSELFDQLVPEEAAEPTGSVTDDILLPPDAGGDGPKEDGR
ncbi:MAG: hypothetical protein H6825_15975 [Planctomycetes bacterium]|nr:hypothetical protein [Planctomycetota bacterium]